MTLNYELSPFQPAQAAEVIGWVRTPTEARAWCGRQEATLPTAAIFAEWHKDQDVHPYLLAAQSLPVAYGEIWVDRTAGEIELARLIVRPDHRGQGVGRRLVAELLAVAAQFGLDCAYVRVLPENQPALTCYRHSGFIRVAVSDEQSFNQRQPVQYVWLRRQFPSNG